MLTSFDATEQTQAGETVSAGYVPNWNLTFSFSFIPNGISTVQLATGPVRVPVEGHQLLDIFKVDKDIEFQVGGRAVNYTWPEAQWATVHRVRGYEEEAAAWKGAASRACGARGGSRDYNGGGRCPPEPPCCFVVEYSTSLIHRRLPAMGRCNRKS